MTEIVPFIMLGSEIKKRLDGPVAAGTEALNHTANQAKKRLKENMAKVFDRVTPYALNAIKVSYATDENQQASIYINDEQVNNGARGVDFLAPEIFGGKRKSKRSEQAFIASGVLSPKEQYAAGKNAPKDQYGNIKRGAIQKALANTRSYRDQLQNTPRGKKRKSPEYFARKLNPEDKSATIFQRVSPSEIIPLFIPIKPATYKARFHFKEIIDEVYEKNLQPNYNTALMRIWSAE